jgi:hypothetical protein
MKRPIISRVAIFMALLILTTGWIASAQQTLSESEAAARRLTGKPVPTDANIVPDAAMGTDEKSVSDSPLFAGPMCTICYTCGGDWPNFAGAIYTPNGAIEREPQCAGGLFSNTGDTSPFLCCRP